MLRAIAGCIAILPAFAAAQVPAGVPRDTSFSVASAFAKEVKRRPHISVAGITTDGVRLEKGLVFRNVGNRALKTDVFSPTTKATKHSAVLLVFGGGWKSGDRTHNYAMASWLAAHGYVAVTADYRLTPEAPYPAAVHDLKAAVRWMRASAKKLRIDTARIAVLGCSAGGQLAALIGATNGDALFEEISSKGPSSRVQAVVDIDGVLAFHHPESSEGTAAAEWLGGTYAQHPQTWDEASALTHIDADAPPFLFLASSSPRFQAGRGDVVRKLDSLGIYSDVHVYEDTPHTFWFFNPWFEPMMQRILSFLNARLTR